MFVSIIFIHLFFLTVTSSLKPNLTLDEFYTYKKYTSIIVSPDNPDFIVVQTRDHVWDKSKNEFHLNLVNIKTKTNQLITNSCSPAIKPIWFNQFVVYLNDDTNQTQTNNYSLTFYSIRNQQTYTIPVGNELIHTICWSNNTNSLYYAITTPLNNQTNVTSTNEWNDVIQYRIDERGDSIFRLNINDLQNYTIQKLTNVSLKISQMICSSDGNQIIFTTSSLNNYIEKMEDFEIYSFYPNNLTISQLTNNTGYEMDLKWFDKTSILFSISGFGSVDKIYKDYQGRVYLLNLTNNQIQRWAHLYQGHIVNYDVYENGIIFVGQINTTMQIYTQSSLNSAVIQQTYSYGSYRYLNTINEKIIFTFSSFDQPEEIYSVNHISQINSSFQITDENNLFTQRNLPKGTSYEWTNKDDNVQVQGVLLYPPDQFLHKNLSLVVLMHGGPYEADLNIFRADWYYTGIMFAAHGWLVLQPNYRGSTGYGDEFLNGLLYNLVSRPGKDVLYGVESLIKDGIANPLRLCIGGYSYGGYITNWLITQTNIFNCALSGAGAVEHVVDWGTTDMPFINHHALGVYPWEKPTHYVDEGAIYQMNKVCTPTHIVTGQMDIRVPAASSYILERSLTILNIPNRLLVFPGVGHSIRKNPWHEKIKIREELKWLDKYGHIRPDKCQQIINSANQLKFTLYLFIFFYVLF